MTEDGGYYAIKGFAYQFDKTIIEVLQHDSPVYVEHDEDIETKKYHIQVKHKETQDYSPYKIRKPIKKFLESLKMDLSGKFRLYCYFRDRAPAFYESTVKSLKDILGVEQKSYDDDFLEYAKDRITIEFSENYDEQFNVTISLVQKELRAESYEQALCFHAILRSHLSDISVMPSNQRLTSKEHFKRMVSSRQRALFDGAYKKYLGKEKYLDTVRAGFFIATSVSALPIQRLFIISIDDMQGVGNIKAFVNSIALKYYHKKHSLYPPTVCVIGHDEALNVAKQELVRDLVKFTDGTCFDGDNFNWDVFKIVNPIFRSSTVRFISKDRLLDSEARNFFDHIFFFGSEGERTPLTSSRGKTVEIECDDINDALQLITGKR